MLGELTDAGRADAVGVGGVADGAERLSGNLAQDSSFLLRDMVEGSNADWPRPIAVRVALCSAC